MEFAPGTIVRVRPDFVHHWPHIAGCYGRVLGSGGHVDDRQLEWFVGNPCDDGLWGTLLLEKVPDDQVAYLLLGET